MAVAMSPTRNDIVDYVERSIIDGSFKPGTLLPSERVLADLLAVGRSTVREALRVLDERQLVSIHQGRGVFVREPSFSGLSAAFREPLRYRRVTARDVIVSRSVVERETAAAAAATATQEDLSAISAALRHFEKVEQTLDQVDADLAFHRLIAKASHNPVLEAMFESISGLTAEIMLRSLGDRAIREEGLPIHDLIFNAIEAKDATGARDLMDQHLSVVLQKYGSDLDEVLQAVTDRQLDRLGDLDARHAILRRIGDSL